MLTAEKTQPNKLVQREESELNSISTLTFVCECTHTHLHEKQKVCEETARDDETPRYLSFGS